MVGLTVVVVVVLYVSIALFAIVMVKGWEKKTIVLVIFILIPTADVIAGRIYFKYLCNTRSGQFIYTTVEIGEEYLYQPGEMMKHKLDEAGNQYAIAEGGETNREKLRERYDLPFSKKESYSRIFHIEKRERIIKDQIKTDILSKSISFLYGGGWVINLYPSSLPLYCEENQKPTSKENIHARLFDKTFMSQRGNNIKYEVQK